MSRRLRLVRRASQLLFLAGFVALFIFAADLPRPPVPVDLYLRADPLLALSAMVSLRKLLFPLVWYALPVTALSIVAGRAFCAWVCPMGTTIDALERVCRLRGRARRDVGWRQVKFYVLIAMLVTLVLPAAHRAPSKTGLSDSVGLSAVYLMDPIALLTRTVTWVGLPATQWGTRLASDTVTGWSYASFVARHPTLDRALAPVQLALNAVTRPVYFRLGLITFLVFVGIVALGRFERRFWCRNLCPLGALLGVLGRFSPLRLAVSDKCTRCLRCVNECKVGAITEDPTRYRGPECVQCYTCIAICPERAISLAIGYDATARDEALRLDRRRMLGAIGAGLAAVAIPKVSIGARKSDATEKVLKISSLRLIRPPGALAEDEFITACVRCGECMKACVTNTLQPAVGEGGLEALGTPVIVPRAGPCAQSCNLCGQLCPTGAIAPFTAEEKRHLYLGTASVDRSTCIAWSKGRECMICDEACPYDAIAPDAREQEAFRPIVDERICVGCGMCEWVCPVEPLGAIRVDSSGDRRHLSRERQRGLRDEAEQERTGGSQYPGLG